MKAEDMNRATFLMVAGFVVIVLAMLSVTLVLTVRATQQIKANALAVAESNNRILGAIEAEVEGHGCRTRQEFRQTLEVIFDLAEQVGLKPDRSELPRRENCPPPTKFEETP